MVVDGAAATLVSLNDSCGLLGNQRRMTSGGLLTKTLFSAAGDTVNLAATEVEYESRRVQRTRSTMDVLFIMMEKVVLQFVLWMMAWRYWKFWRQMTFKKKTTAIHFFSDRKTGYDKRSFLCGGVYKT